MLPPPIPLVASTTAQPTPFPSRSVQSGKSTSQTVRAGPPGMPPGPGRQDGKPWQSTRPKTGTARPLYHLPFSALGRQRILPGRSGGRRLKQDGRLARMAKRGEHVSGHLGPRSGQAASDHDDHRDQPPAPSRDPHRGIVARASRQPRWRHGRLPRRPRGPRWSEDQPQSSWHAAVVSIQCDQPERCAWALRALPATVPACRGRATVTRPHAPRSTSSRRYR